MSDDLRGSNSQIDDPSLWAKYGEECGLARSQCFNGAQYVVKDPEEAGLLCKVQAMVDQDEVEEGRQKEGEHKWQKSIRKIIRASTKSRMPCWILNAETGEFESKTTFIKKKN
jgi:hypothetical protein